MRLTRRQFFALAGVAGRHAIASGTFRLAISSKTFDGNPFETMCRLAASTGYGGLEVAPFTLAEDPAALPQSKLVEFRRAMKSEGVRFVGLHSVLGTTPLSVTTPDPALRRRSWDYFRKMMDLSAALGDGGTMVFLGSPQRRTAGVTTAADAIERIKEGLVAVAKDAESRGLTILVEPIAPHLCDVINTLDQALDIVDAVRSPAVQSMLDTHNTAAEKLPVAELVRKFYPHIRHIHFNEMDGRRPGAGNYDFKAVMRTLKDLGYNRWISVEAFDFRPDGKTVALESSRFIRRLETELN
jgi:sugar phosphate isomerase/epimerase